MKKNNNFSQEVVDNVQLSIAYYQEIISYLAQNKPVSVGMMKFFDSSKNAQIATKILEELYCSPEKFMNTNLEYMQKVQKLMIDSMEKFAGGGESQEEVLTQKKDSRFKDPAWHSNVYFDFIRKYYLLSSDWVQNNIKQYDFDDETRKYAEFISKQFVDAISPSNFVFSNPEVIKTSLDSKMQNIAQGMKNFLEDIKKSRDLFKITTTDAQHFQLGKNIAVTPGKVVYENKLMQLILYEPKEKIYSIPLLIVPPCINKYYILDLSEKNSLVNWLASNNQQVFLISWKNPNAEMANIGFDDYIESGIFAAIDTIQKLGHTRVNALGYCIGGTMLACAAAIEAKSKTKTINSMTLLTTLIDFSKPGEIGTFINKNAITSIENELKTKGYLDGRYLSNSFSLIRANDLVWSFFINNYLLGKSPAAFDILFWNSDATNLPAKMYSYYMRNMYLENSLIIPNKLELVGQKIDLTKIKVPSFFLAAKEDHIALWQAVFEGAKVLGGKKTFCLTDAGHVAGVVNPVTNTKYSHKIHDLAYENSDEWIQKSEVKNGSWWVSWGEWLTERSGFLEYPKSPYIQIKEIEAAPGRYVQEMPNSLVSSQQ